ncbi:hypothetical protein BD413DRAFT_476225, partial [Trametes elegans]
WVVLGSLVSFGASLLYLLFHQASTPRPSRWLGPVHFTIPVLSPFASVIEHETSAVNVPLVAISLFAAGLFAFLWFRCRFTRP